MALLNLTWINGIFFYIDQKLIKIKSFQDYEKRKSSFHSIINFINVIHWVKYFFIKRNQIDFLYKGNKKSFNKLIK